MVGTRYLYLLHCTIACYCCGYGAFNPSLFSTLSPPSLSPIHLTAVLLPRFPLHAVPCCAS